MGEKRGWIGGWDAWSEVGDRYRGFRIDPMEKLLERKIGESFEGVFLLINI